MLAGLALKSIKGQNEKKAFQTELDNLLAEEKTYYVLVAYFTFFAQTSQYFSTKIIPSPTLNKASCLTTL
jgi:hypothetical protein